MRKARSREFLRRIMRSDLGSSFVLVAAIFGIGIPLGVAAVWLGDLVGGTPSSPGTTRGAGAMIVAITVGVGQIAIPIAVAAVTWWRRPRPTDPGRCGKCGYDLRASPARCPECGTPRPFGSARRFAKPPATQRPRVATLHVEGLLAIGFEPTGRYALVVSRGGRAVYDTRRWRRVAHDESAARPDDDGIAVGIGPIARLRMYVAPIGVDGPSSILSPDGRFRLTYADGAIDIEQYR